MISDWHTGGDGCFCTRGFRCRIVAGAPSGTGESRKIVMVRGWIVQGWGWNAALSSEEACKQLPGLCLEHATVPSAHFPREKSCMHGVLNEVYLQKKILEMNIIFRDESNDSN